MKREFLTKQETITEGLGEDAARAEQDHEVQMARADCFYAAKDAIELHRILSGISEAEGIEGWVAGKITLAADYLRAVKEHLEYKSMEHAQVAEQEPAVEFIEEDTTAGAIATSMAGGNGFVNGGPGTLKRFKKKEVSEGLPSVGSSYSTGSQGGNTAGSDTDDDEEVVNALKKAGNSQLANKVKTGTTFNKDEMKAIIAAKG
jgi:hypothetical protein